MANYLVVTVGFLISLALLIFALRSGRIAPVRRLPWLIAIIVLGIDVAYHAVVSVAALATGGGWEAAWLPIGTLAIAGVLAIAILQPRIAGWWFIASAALMPAVLAIGDAIFTSGTESEIPIAVMLGFYSTRAAIVGGLLVWSAHPNARPA